MHFYKPFLSLLLLLLLFSGCGTNPKTDSSTSNENNVEYTNIATSKKSDQGISNQVKEILRNDEKINSIKVVNSPKSVLVGINVNHLERFKLKQIRKKVKKQIEDEFPKLDVVVSTDKKILLELDRLEQDIQSNSISKKKRQKALKELTKLAKEET